MFNTISVIGGDLRQLTLAQMLKKDGYSVKLFGFTNEINTYDVTPAENLHDALDCDIVILPVPVSFDNININMPYSDSPLSIKELLENINPLSVVFGGRISKQFSDILSEKGLKHSDYMTRDELAIKNAVPTAEGAIEIAMKETPITIHGSKCLVMGYGKIGKILSKFLDGLGAKTYVMARKYADLALIEGHNCYPLTVKEAKMMLSDFDVIFNTVPAIVLGEKELKKINPSSLVIDLASKPGGVDFDKAKELGVHVIWALSLPGKVAPVTSGIIIKETISNIISEMEV